MNTATISCILKSFWILRGKEGLGLLGVELVFHLKIYRDIQEAGFYQWGKS